MIEQVRINIFVKRPATMPSSQVAFDMALADEIAEVFSVEPKDVEVYTSYHAVALLEGDE